MNSQSCHSSHSPNWCWGQLELTYWSGFWIYVQEQTLLAPVSWNYINLLMVSREGLERSCSSSLYPNITHPLTFTHVIARSLLVLNPLLTQPHGHSEVGRTLIVRPRPCTKGSCTKCKKSGCRETTKQWTKHTGGTYQADWLVCRSGWMDSNMVFGEWERATQMCVPCA